MQGRDALPQREDTGPPPGNFQDGGSSQLPAPEPDAIVPAPQMDAEVPHWDIGVKVPPPPGPTVGAKPAKLDLLFVVDNSGSMVEEQQRLAAAIPAFLHALRDPAYGPDGSGRPCEALDASGCKTPELFIGVITTDLGAGNYALPSCETAGGDGARLVRLPGYGPELEGLGVMRFDGADTSVEGEGDAGARTEEALAKLVSVGMEGCGFEQPLEAARRALDPATSQGFGQRVDAALAVVFLTDEDDCSAKRTILFNPTLQSIDAPLGPLSSFRCFEFGIQCDINDRNVAGPRHNCVPAYDYLHSVDGYRAFFSSLRAPGWVHLATISGPTQPVAVGKDGPNPMLMPSCQSIGGSAVPAIRLQAALESSQTVEGSICDATYDATLNRFADAILRR